MLDVLRDLFVIRGVPRHIRSDNGPEFIAEAIRKYLTAAGVETLYVEPGSPWQNGYAESFHSRLRSSAKAWRARRGWRYDMTTRRNVLVGMVASVVALCSWAPDAGVNTAFVRPAR